jgi:hypothetical protein
MYHSLDFMGSDYVSELLPLPDILFIPQMIWIGERRWNDIDRKNLRTRRKTCPTAYFVHHKFHMDLNGGSPGLRGERPTTNHLSHGTANVILTLLYKTIEFGNCWSLTEADCCSAKGANHTK